MRGVILTGVQFAVGVGEALLYYNLGQAEGSAFKFRVPPPKDFIKTAGLVLVTSILTTALFRGIENFMAEEEEVKKQAA